MWVVVVAQMLVAALIRLAVAASTVLLVVHETTM